MNDESAHPTVVSATELSNSFLGKLIEICFVTTDHRRTMEGLVLLGIGPWRVYTFDSATVKAIGTTVETYSIPKGFVWPEPEQWYPGPPPAGESPPVRQQRH